MAIDYSQMKKLGLEMETSLDEATNDAINILANKITELLQENVNKNKSEYSTGELEKSISPLPVKKEGGNYIIEIEWEEYGTYQDAGVKGIKSGTSLGSQLGYGKDFAYSNKMPPPDSFKRFAKSTNTSPFASARSVFYKGIRPTLWASNTIESREMETLLDGVAEVIKKEFEA
jgi:hypothetical protein